MNILFATDGSMDALAADEILIRLGQGADNRLTVVSVIQNYAYVSGRIDGEWQRFWSDKETRAAHHIVKEAADRLGPFFPETETRVYLGHPSEEILKAAEEIEADLIVVGSQGHSALKDWVLGSVSQAVLEKASCSVLVGRALTGSLSKIVLAYDGSSESEAAFEWIGRLPQHAGFKVEVLSVAEPAPSPATGPLLGWPMGYEELYNRVVELQRNSAREMATSGADALTQQGIPASSHTCLGDAAFEISRLAEETAADLVVIGAHSRHGWIRDLLGNTTRGVIKKSTCSVLVARSGQAHPHEKRVDTEARVKAGVNLSSQADTEDEAELRVGALTD